MLAFGKRSVKFHEDRRSSGADPQVAAAEILTSGPTRLCCITMKAALLAAIALLVSFASFAADTTVRTKQMLSPVYSIEKKYRSMEGPGSQQHVYLGDPDAAPELV